MGNEVQTTNDSDDARKWATIINASVFCGLVFPLGNFLAPLVIWQLKKDISSLVDDQGKSVLNFQLTVFIAAVICGFLMFAVVGFILLPLLSLYALVMTIIAIVKVNDGENYKFPYSFTFIK